MNRKKLLKIVNICLGLLFLNMAITGLSADLIPYDIYRVVHAQVGKAFVLFAIAHITLNWGWIKNTLLKKKRTPTA